jgi:hypothetical protein
MAISRVKLLRLLLAKLPIETITGKSEFMKKCLMIELELLDVNAKKKVDIILGRVRIYHPAQPVF